MKLLSCASLQSSQPAHPERKSVRSHTMSSEISLRADHEILDAELAEALEGARSATYRRTLFYVVFALSLWGFVPSFVWFVLAAFGMNFTLA